MALWKLDGVITCVCAIVVVQALVTMAADNVMLKGSRLFPLCITEDSINEYQSNFAKKPDFSKIFQKVSDGSLKYVPITATVGGGLKKQDGHLLMVKYYQIKPNLWNVHRGSATNGSNAHNFYANLRQWVHIVIHLHVGVEKLIVQAMNFPMALPWGVFDLQYSDRYARCPGAYGNEGRTGNAIGLRRQASPIPCKRRSYLHVQHPHVYAYDGNKRTEFHMNFNYFDTTCRELKYLQFLIASQETSSSDPKFVRTAVIKHDFQDSNDGMPYPVHPDFILSVLMHDYEIPFEPAFYAQANIPMNKYYDDCVLAPYGDKNVEDSGENYLSRFVCKKPERHRCDFSSSKNVPGSSSSSVEPSPQLCPEQKPGKQQCDVSQSTVAIEIDHKLRPSTYKARRFHGYAMILGCIYAQVVSAFVARYYKESRGCGLMVGWWAWGHHLITLVCCGATWLGIVIMLYYPPKEENSIATMVEPRNSLNKFHTQVGVICVIVFHISWISGPVRPRKPLERVLAISLHLLSGYGTIILGALSVLFSTSCYEVKLYTGVMIAVGMVAFIAGFVIQIVGDLGKPLIPARAYFPVIEAVGANMQTTIVGLIQVIVLVVFSIITVALFYMTVKYGGYEGYIMENACQNCIWKWDEWINVRETSTSGVTSTPREMHSAYGCAITDVSYEEGLGTLLGL